MNLNNTQYQYIWNVIYETLKKEENVEKIKFIISEYISPYMEINQEHLNFLKEKIEIEVNPFLRFNNILSNMIDINIEKNYEEIRKILFNVISHILANIDLYEGMNKRIIISRKISKEIENGEYGNDIQNLFNEFSRNEKIKISNAIYDLYKHSNGMIAFENILRKIFPDSIVYNEKLSDTKLILYIGNKKTEKNKRKFKLLQKIFLPLGLNCKIYWEYHFGVIGVDETSKIEDFSIF